MKVVLLAALPHFERESLAEIYVGHDATGLGSAVLGYEVHVTRSPGGGRGHIDAQLGNAFHYDENVAGTGVMDIQSGKLEISDRILVMRIVLIPWAMETLATCPR